MYLVKTLYELLPTDKIKIISIGIGKYYMWCIL